MESGAQFEQRTDGAMNGHGALGWGNGVCDNRKKSRFSGSIVTNETYGFSFLDLEGNIFQGGKCLCAPSGQKIDNGCLQRS